MNLFLDNFKYYLLKRDKTLVQFDLNFAAAVAVTTAGWDFVGVDHIWASDLSRIGSGLAMCWNMRTTSDLMNLFLDNFKYYHLKRDKMLVHFYLNFAEAVAVSTAGRDFIIVDLIRASGLSRVGSGLAVCWNRWAPGDLTNLFLNNLKYLLLKRQRRHDEIVRKFSDSFK